MSARHTYPVVVMRGGSSRALVFHRDALPDIVAAQDRIFLAALGCPDPTGRQVDGLGGGASSNNKVAMVGPSREPGADVEFTFGQLSPDHAFVDRAGTCGNISSAIGPFAIEEGLVEACDPVTSVAIRNTNVGQMIVAHVPTPGGRFEPEGDYEIAGVRGSGARITLDFLEPSGSAGAGPLPSGSPCDVLDAGEFGSLRCSLVDAAKPCVLVPFAELSLGPETRPEQLDADRQILAQIEAARAAGAVAMGIAADAAAATAKTPSVPQLAFFQAAGPDALRVLGMSMGKAHQALPLTVAICLAAAAAIPDTLVGEAVGEAVRAGQPIALLHPSGRIDVGASLAADGVAVPRVERVSVARTARRLFEGVVHVRPAC